MSAWVAVVCIGIGSLAFRIAPLAFADRTTSPRVSRIIKDAGAAAVAAITIASLDRAAQTGEILPLAVAGGVGLAVALKGGSMLKVVLVGTALFVTLAAIV